MSIHYFINTNYLIGDNYALKMRFIDHIFDDQAIDDLTVKIILPEGAKLVIFIILMNTHICLFI